MKWLLAKQAWLLAKQAWLLAKRAWYRALLRSVFVVVALVTALGGVRPVTAREPDPVPTGGQRDLFRLLEDPQIVSDLGLTTGQVTALRDKLFDIRRQIIDLKVKIDLARLELEYLMGSEEIDEKKAFALVDEVKQLETAVEKLRIGQTVAENRILTRKQRQILAKIYQERKPSLAPRDDMPLTPSAPQHSPGQGSSVNRSQGPPLEWDDVVKVLEEDYHERTGK